MHIHSQIGSKSILKPAKENLEHYGFALLVSFGIFKSVTKSEKQIECESVFCILKRSWILIHPSASLEMTHKNCRVGFRNL